MMNWDKLGHSSHTGRVECDHLGTAVVSQAVGRRDAVLVPSVDSLQLLGADTRPLALLQQQLELGHLHLGGQTGRAVLVSYQSLQHRRVDTEGTAAGGFTQ